MFAHKFDDSYFRDWAGCSSGGRRGGPERANSLAQMTGGFCVLEKAGVHDSISLFRWALVKGHVRLDDAPSAD
jgi:hypothetical protein